MTDSERGKSTKQMKQDAQVETVRSWTVEVDEYELHCQVKRFPEMGHYTGYAECPDDIAEISMDDLMPHIDVHGGITHKENNTVGFDCAHAGDVCLDNDGEPFGFREELELHRSDDDPLRQVWSSADVVEETEALATQLVTLDQEEVR